MNDDKTIEVRIPVAQPVVSGLLATVVYALLVFNMVLPYYGISMGYINGGVALGLFVILHTVSHATSKLVSDLYYEIAMDKAALKSLIDKLKELGTFSDEDGLTKIQGEVDEK